MVIPRETFQTINIYARVAGLVIDGDAVMMENVKAVSGVDDVKAGLLNAANRCRSLALLCEQAHDRLTTT